MKKNTSSLILKGKVRLTANPSMKGTATLYGDRVVIKCRTFFSSFKREFKFSELESYNWWAGRGDANFAFYLKSGEDILVFLKGAGNWKSFLDEKFDEKLGQNMTPPVDPSPEEKALADLLRPIKSWKG